MKKAYKIWIKIFLYLIIFCFIIAGYLLWRESRFSNFQSRIFEKQASKLEWSLQKGANKELQFPSEGPLDIRRGYVALSTILPSLSEAGWSIDSQAHWSKQLDSLVASGLWPVYPEKAQAGLQLIGMDGQDIFNSPFPAKVFANLDSIPDLIVQTLLWLEDRKILDNNAPYLNPAVNWPRFMMAASHMGLRRLGFTSDMFGASTLAVQMEKYKHSGGGYTSSTSDKLKQMKAASLRAYINGRETMQARRAIVTDYINTVPLAAFPGYGEVNGIAEGLWIWYGLNPDSIQSLRKLRWGQPDSQFVDSNIDIYSSASNYRKVISLFLAHRRPSDYLLSKQNNLESLTNRHLRALSQQGKLNSDFVDTAIQIKLQIRKAGTLEYRFPFASRKAVSALRNRLLQLFGTSNLYALDRLDAEVFTTLHPESEMKVGNLLQSLHDKKTVDSLELNAFRLLQKGDPSHVVYSFALFESTDEGNMLRIQTDNFNQPLDINEGVKLDLGSTAKLRTLISYLEIINELYDYKKKDSLKIVLDTITDLGDPITRWANEYLSSKEEASREDFLRAALDRTYSGNPFQHFFTGGGQHIFHNFDAKTNGGNYSVLEALRQSINLPYIRLMRDVISYKMERLPGITALRSAGGDSLRQVYLRRFAEQEGMLILYRFWKKYRQKSIEGVHAVLLESLRPTPKKLAIAYLSVHPNADSSEVHSFVAKRGAEKDSAQGESIQGEKIVSKMIRQFRNSSFSWNDKGYLAGVHPLELWVAAEVIAKNPPNWDSLRSGALPIIEDAYSWLITSKKRKTKIEGRVFSMMEAEAFQELHHSWKNLGYPFESLVPSLATALGASADKPFALAELVGILQNEGKRVPMCRVNSIRFARNTPYETLLTPAPVKVVQVLHPAVAKVARECLLDVVNQGTARRAFHSFPDGKGGFLELGGKTGTGDHKKKLVAADGTVTEAKAISRSATFVFVLGTRFFGTLTAYVMGQDAENYGFTSSLPVQILKIIAPKISPLVIEKENAANEKKNARKFSSDNLPMSKENKLFNRTPFQLSKPDTNYQMSLQ